jgi:integrase/recombinase XerD
MRMLNFYPTFKENAIMWLKEYLKYKALTLGNVKADQEELKKGLDLIDESKTLDKVYKAYKQIRKAGVGINTQFVPVYRFIKYIIEKNKYQKMENIDTIDVLEWLQFETAGKRNDTKKNYKNAIHNFFVFLSQNNVEQKYFNIDIKNWQRNLSNAIKNQKYVYLNKNEVARFLDTLETYEQSYKNSKEPNPYFIPPYF